MSEEVWKSINGYEDVYEVSNLGRVKSLARIIRQKNGRKRQSKTRILSPISLGNYHGVQLCNGEGTKKHYIHRLVCTEFLGIPADKKNIVNHKDGDKYNNQLINLEWSTYSENIRHAYRNGLNKGSGENSHYAKFSDEVVKEVREKYDTGMYLQKELSEIYGISKMQIHRIVKHKNRKIYVGDE